VLDGNAEQQKTTDEDEDQRRRDEHRAAERRRPLAAKGAHGEDEQQSADDADCAAGDGDAHQRLLKVRLHGADTTTMKLPIRFTAAIFDFDETMIDLERQHTDASAALCRELGDDYERMPESWRRGSGRRVIDDVRDLREFFGWQRDVDELFALRQQHFDRLCDTADLALLPGVERTVRALHERGVTLAVASSAVGGSIDAILRRFGLRSLFALIVDGSEVVHGKPDPEAYLLTARRLGVTPGECIVFEDSAVGVAAAKAAGMECIAIRNPHAQQRQDLSAADAVLESFEELVLASS
jgi:beta-phosphoglucomutase